MLAAAQIQSIDLLYWQDSLLDFLLRLVLAAVAGFVIGFERKSRSKEAGVRTHTLVALGSALMMIVSKYAFADLFNGLGITGATGADASRIASQIVTGIGFLGAGTIIYQRGNLRGLTTAAGIWATAGLGMAFGSGMYVVGAIATVLMLAVQVVLHLPIKLFRARMFLVVHATLVLDGENVLEQVREIFKVRKFLKFKTFRMGDSTHADVEMHTPTQFTAEQLYAIVEQYPFILSIEQNEEF
ncbi:MAG: MgtC/SapB family protein [Clostridia bacterium]|nr:MgtC/SapB family protein [Clostridia bacterium]